MNSKSRRKKKPETIRTNISTTGKELLRALAVEQGTTMTDVLEHAIRSYAKSLGVTATKESAR